MAVDERKLGEWIHRNAEIVAPPAFVLLAYFVLAGTQWPMAGLALCLAAWYHHSGWGGMVLVYFGIAAIALSALLLYGQASSATYLAISGYWLCVAGALRLLSGFVFGAPKEPAERKAGEGRKEEKRRGMRRSGGGPD